MENVYNSFVIKHLNHNNSNWEKEKTDKSILASASEKLCELYSKKHGLDIKTVQIPYLYSGTYKKDFLYGVFEDLYNKKTVRIPEASTSKMHFLSLGDLSDLIARIVDNWKGGSGVLSVGDEFFRKKSLKRVNEMIHSGSTVLMVSHGMKFRYDATSGIQYYELDKLTIDEVNRKIKFYEDLNGPDDRMPSYVGSA